MNASAGVRVEAADEVDDLVDALIEDPTKAEDVKAALKRRISKPQVIDLRSTPATLRSHDTDDDETADMWDNVPV